MKPRVLVSAPYAMSVIADYRAKLEAAGCEIVVAKVAERLSEAELLPLIGDIDGVICGDDKFTAKVFAAAPRLKVISKWGTGIDSIDREAARARGVAVRNTPNAFTEPLADTVLASMLLFARKPDLMTQTMRSGEWTKPPLFALGEKVLGIVGVGNCGKAVARRAKAFGMRLLGNDIIEVDKKFIIETGLEMLPFKELLEKSDFISLHADLNPGTHRLINDAAFALMKPSSYLINTARGPMVDEAALARALRDKKIAGAALDVFEDEPLPPSSPLRGFSNCYLYPHNSNSSPRAWAHVHENTILNLLRGLGLARA